MQFTNTLLHRHWHTLSWIGETEVPLDSCVVIYVTNAPHLGDLVTAVIAYRSARDSGLWILDDEILGALAPLPALLAETAKSLGLVARVLLENERSTLPSHLLRDARRLEAELRQNLLEVEARQVSRPHRDLYVSKQIFPFARGSTLPPAECYRLEVRAEDWIPGALPPRPDCPPAFGRVENVVDILDTLVRLFDDIECRRDSFASPHSLAVLDRLRGCQIATLLVEHLVRPCSDSPIEDWVFASDLRVEFQDRCRVAWERCLTSRPLRSVFYSHYV